MGRHSDVVVCISSTSWEFDQIPVEIAWWQQRDLHQTVFVPPHAAADVANGDPEVLEGVGYESRQLDPARTEAQRHTCRAHGRGMELGNRLRDAESPLPPVPVRPETMVQVC